MKILLIHKFHYMRGGTETFHFNLAEALLSAGHEVVYFSMSDDRNIPCAQEKYFVSNVDYNNPNMGKFEKVKNGFKLIYSYEAKKNIEMLIENEQPDIAHIGLINRQITYSVVDVLNMHKIPIVMHIHDLMMVCPCYTMLKPNGSICEECLYGHKYSCIKNKCIKNSLSKSVLGYIEAKFIQLRHYYNKIDLLIAECDFYKQLIERSKITSTCVVKMNNFLPISQKYESITKNKEYILYFGRYAHEKGVNTLLKAYSILRPKQKLVLVGTGEELDQIKKFVRSNQLTEKVEINGAIFGERMNFIIDNAKIIVVPSEWYENGAFVALQAMARGKVVIASNIAGLSEIIPNDKYGYLFEPGDANSLVYAMKQALALDDKQYMSMSKDILEYIRSRCNHKAYIEQLTKIYEELISRKQYNEEVKRS